MANISGNLSPTFRFPSYDAICLKAIKIFFLELFTSPDDLRNDEIKSHANVK